MILQRLFALALRENLLDDPAFEVTPVPWVVLVGDGGEYRGLEERRPDAEIPSKKKDAPPKKVPGKGEPLSVPRAHGNTANAGFARYFVDTLARVLPLDLPEKDRNKADASRATFWRQIGEAVDATADPGLIAVQAFWQRREEFLEQLRADASRRKLVLTERVTFAYQPDGGRTIVQSPAVRAWFGTLYARINGTKQAAGPVGVCQVTGEVGPLPTTHATKLQGVPGGMSVGVSLISFDKPAFGHYGLDGAANAGIGYPATDGYLRALDALLKNALPSVRQAAGKSNLRVGGTAFLYWTRDPADVRFMSLFDDPSDDRLKDLPKPRRTGTVATVFDAAAAGTKVADRAVDANRFFVLGLSGNAARAVVRGYLEAPLAEAKANLADWFADLRIADTSKDYAGRPNDKFPLWQLVLATAFDADAVAPDTGERLLTAALTGGPVPESLLALCLRRLTAEGSAAFRASRMALVKLILIRRGIPVDETLNPKGGDPAYVYGRVLAVLEQIQYAALGDVNANVVDKFYGTLSAAPAMVFGRLQDNARNHLRKLRGDKPGTAVALEKRLMEVCGLLAPAPPPRQFSLQDQGLFALGYYHEKAKRFAEAAERKAAKITAEDDN